MQNESEDLRTEEEKMIANLSEKIDSLSFRVATLEENYKKLLKFAGEICDFAIGLSAEIKEVQK
jgi:hypothetical protein